MDPLFCDRCAVQLHPGSGDHFRVRIEAFADPAPPVLGAQDDPQSIRRRMKKLLEQLSDLSAQEAMDQVHRRLVLHLCLNCYGRWIDHPTGES